MYKSMAFDFDRKKRLVDLLNDLAGDSSQRALARRLEVSGTTVNKWFNPEDVAFPGQDSLEKIAKLKLWTLDELLSHLAGAPKSRKTPISKILQEIRSMNIDEVVQVFDAGLERIKELNAEKSKPKELANSKK